MLSRHEHSGLIWIDLESPSRDEMRMLAQEFGLKPLIMEELLVPSIKPRAEFYENYAFFVLHFPSTRHGMRAREQEIDFVVGRNFIITVRYEASDPLHQFAKVFEDNSILDEHYIGEHAGFLLYYILKELYKSVENEVDSVRNDLVNIEDHIYQGNEVDMVAEISRSARDLLNLRQSIEPHREILHILENEGVKFFGPEFASYLRLLSNEYYRVHNHIMRETESLHELRETNNSLLTTKQNETMKMFTIMAFVTFPLSLIVSLFDLSVGDNPFHTMPNAFWVAVTVLAGLMIIMYGYFKHKKWL